jgi:segregation and condensation protein A
VSENGHVDPPEDEEDGEEQRPQPIYPTGPAMRVPMDAVQLTFLDPEALRGTLAGTEGEEDEPEAGFEIRSPIGIRLPVFEGPLDLLLYLIRRDKLDIYDIPIGHITAQYLGTLEAMKVLDLDVAGDFLVMAATLMRLKARMLLPTWPEGEEDEEDPRWELVRQLLEYRQYKEAARRLKDREEDRRRWYARGYVPVFEGELPAELEPVSPFALIDIMKDILSRVGEEFFYEVELEDVTLEEKIALVMGEVRDHGRALFFDLMTRFPRRLHVVVTFMAILELAKRGQIAVAQEAAFGQIWVYAVRDGRIVAADEGAVPSREPAPGEDIDGSA